MPEYPIFISFNEPMSESEAHELKVLLQRIPGVKQVMGFFDRQSFDQEKFPVGFAVSHPTRTLTVGEIARAIGRDDFSDDYAYLKTGQ